MKPTMSVGPNAVRTNCMSDPRARVALAICPMWYSSQKIRNRRTLSFAASVAACDRDRIVSDTSSSAFGCPSALTYWKARISWVDAVFLELEIAGRERGHGVAVAVEDDGVHADELGSRAKHGLRGLRGRRLAGRGLRGRLALGGLLIGRSRPGPGAGAPSQRMPRAIRAQAPVGGLTLISMRGSLRGQRRRDKNY